MATRKLTTGEIRLLSTVFGSALDYDRIDLKRGGLLVIRAAGVTIGNRIHLGSDYYYEDYGTDEVSIGLRSLLVHEAVHVWQHQKVSGYHWSKAGVEHIISRDPYDYRPLDPGKSLLDYGWEQQGQIVQDYYALRAFGQDVTVFERVIYPAIER